MGRARSLRHDDVSCRTHFEVLFIVILSTRRGDLATQLGLSKYNCNI